MDARWNRSSIKVLFDGTAHSILYKQVFEPPPLLIDLRPELPNDLSQALRRALSKDPAHRFPSMEEFADAISGARSAGDTVISSPVRRVRPKRLLLVAVPVAVLAVTTAAWRSFRALGDPLYRRGRNRTYPGGGLPLGLGNPSDQD